MTMRFKRPRHLGWIVMTVIVLGIVIYALIPKPRAVECVTAEPMMLIQSIDADGVIQVRDRFIVAMPVTGMLERIDIEVGAHVEPGTLLAYVVPPEIDERQRQEAVARVQSIETGAKEIQQRLAALRPLVDQSRRRAERSSRLGAEGALAKEQVENAQDAYEQLSREADALQARVEALGFESQAVRATLRARPGQRIALRSPSSGIVLRRYEHSERTLMAGMPILEIGDTTQLEVVVDVLSMDAVKVCPGMTVNVTGWGGDSILRGSVRRIEPFARTRVSSLGIEEQRVHVIADLLSASRGLGDGYKVEASIVRMQSNSLLTLPLGTLLRDPHTWFVFVVDQGRARRRDVKLGIRNARMTTVVSGLRRGDLVVQHPPEDLQEGDRIELIR